MEEFDVSMELQASDARQDKIALSIGVWSIDAIDVAMTAFVNTLGNPERAHPTFQHIAFQQNNPVHEITHKKSIKIISPKQGRGFKENAPLFSGELVIRRKTDTMYELQLMANVNPTRFCAYQHLPLRTRSGTRRLSPQIVLFADQTPETPHDDKEYTLDASTNCLLSTKAILNASNSLYPQNLRRYFEAIVSYVQDEIDSFQHPGFHFIMRAEKYSVNSIETYWDIPCETPLTVLKELAPALETATNSMTIRDYPTQSPDLEPETKGLTPCYSIYFRKGEKLKIYAKTNKKIRIEVTYDFSHHKALRKRWGNNPTNIAALLEFFTHCTNLSTETANDLLRNICQHTNPESSYNYKPINFVLNVYRIVNNIAYAEAILIFISTTGGISATNAPPYMKPSLEKLVRKGLLYKQKGRAPRYIPHPKFINASRQLF